MLALICSVVSCGNNGDDNPEQHVEPVKQQSFDVLWQEQKEHDEGVESADHAVFSSLIGSLKMILCCSGDTRCVYISFARRIFKKSDLSKLSPATILMCSRKPALTSIDPYFG